MALLASATRGIVPADRDVREGEIYLDGKIPRQRYRDRELAAQTVGVVGLGAPGRPCAGASTDAAGSQCPPRQGTAPQV